jgi:hypothetical protein
MNVYLESSVDNDPAPDPAAFKTNCVAPPRTAENLEPGYRICYAAWAYEDECAALNTVFLVVMHLVDQRFPSEESRYPDTHFRSPRGQIIAAIQFPVAEAFVQLVHEVLKIGYVRQRHAQCVGFRVHDDPTF